MSCSHIGEVANVTIGEYACADCVAIGGQWVHLRTCQTCGVTRCCDSSPHQHGSKHAAATAHPVIASAEPGEKWLYCYPDESFTPYA